MRPFVHLHTHSEFSLLDGFSRIQDLVDLAVSYKMPALAVTDHGNMFGAIRHYNACRKAGIKPILGCEVYVAPESRFDRETRAVNEKSGKKFNHHLVLLCENETGYRNLIKVVSKGFTEGFYYKPRVDHALLAEHAEGLICLSACLGGEIPQHILVNRMDDAMRAARFFRDTFGPDRFFIELQNHQQRAELQVIPPLVEIARKLGVGLVATNDSHYNHHEDWVAHDMLLCMQSKKQRDDERRWRFPEGGSFYFKNGDEMAAAFPDYPEALDNTLKIAEMIDLNLTQEYKLPVFDVPPGHTLESYFAEVAREGFAERRKQLLALRDKGLLRKDLDEYTQRLEQEIEVINEMGFPGYFLIIWDFIKFALSKGIPVGPGRGSAAGSLVAYAMNITDIDPLRYDLLFERFLNCERVSMPDVDIDFCQDRRGEVIDYVTEKYGRENVCQIITYGCMKSKMAVKDVGRWLGFTPTETNSIAKLIPDDLKMTLPKALETAPDFRKIYDSDPRTRELIDLSLKLEGLSRNPGVHAAGVIIAPGPVTDYAPIYKDQKKGTVCVQYAKDEAEQVGLLKMDFLGLKTLTVIAKTLEVIAETQEAPVDLNALDPYDDPATYALFCRGETDGIFQFESNGMKELLIRLQPKRFEDFIALNALYRPGPLGSGMVDQFIDGAHGAEVTYEIPALKDVLDETYGVILYQEQVMKVAQIIGGFTLGDADLLRRAMGKKKQKVMDQKKAEFLAGARERGYPAEVCDELFEKMAKFAKYGFNKSHSAAYALIAHQTAFLKANYPLAFMSALLSLDKDHTDKVVQYIDRCRHMNIEILPPDIRRSRRDFSVESGAIRFALGAIKGVGDAAIEAIMKAKEGHALNTFEEFFRVVDLQKVNKKVIEQLIKSGAFDFDPSPRKAKFDAIENLLAWSHKIQEEASGGQANLFGEESFDACLFDRNAAEWDRRDLLAHEKDALGFYFSGHPLDAHAELFRRHTTCDSNSLSQVPPGSEVLIGGQIQALRPHLTAKGQPMAFVCLEDLNGFIDLVVFPDAYEKHRDLLCEESKVVIKGRLDIRNEKPNIVVQEIFPLNQWKLPRIRSCVIEFDADRVSRDQLAALHHHFLANQGDCQVYLDINVQNRFKTVVKPQQLSIDPGRALNQFTQDFPEFKTLFRY